MEPANVCVYNVTRNALLSERVISVSEPQTPAQLLALVMNGPGRDPHVSIRLTHVSMALEIPRLFAFDVAYLNAEQRIIEVADVGPGTALPPLSDEVAAVLFLSDQLLPRTKTAVGDYVRICTEAELAALLRAATQFQSVASPGWPIEAAGPSIAPDPFAGSLIFLPSSGTPQNSEIFLAPVAARSGTADLASEEILAEPSMELTEISTGSEETSSVTYDQISTPESEEPQPEESFAPAPETPATPRFFETALHEPSLSETPPEPAPPPEPRESELPPSLKAVIRFVDEQLRREKEQQRQASPVDFRPVEDEPVIDWRAASLESPEVAEPAALEDFSGEAAYSSTSDQDVGAPADDVAEWSRFQATSAADAEHFAAEDVVALTTEDLPLRGTSSEEIPAIAATSAQPQVQPPISLAGASEADLPDFPGLIVPPPAPAVPPRVDSPPPSVIAFPRLPARVRKPKQKQKHPPSPPEIDKEVEAASATRSKEKLPFAIRVQRWLAGESVSLSGNRRRGERIAPPGLVAFYFTGGAPKPHEILNISTSGLYLRSKELWSPNTLVRMTLERPAAEEGEKQTISVLARVVRIDDGGIGHEFVTTEVLANLRARDFLPQQGTNRKELERFLAIPK